MAPPLTRVLRDFRMTAARPSAAAPPAAGEAIDTAPPAAIGLGETLATRLAAAFAEGEEAGRAAAEAEHQQELAEFHATADARLAEERQRWAEEEGDRLAASLDTASKEIEARIGAQLVNVLTPFLSERLRERMVQDLSAVISEMLTTGAHLRLRISGPGDLLARLGELLGSDQKVIEWSADEGPEIRVIADETLIETDIGRWISRFDEGATG